MLSSDNAHLARDPFAEVRRLEAAFDRLFERAGATQPWWPPVNLWAGETRLVATAELPGLAREDIHVSVEADTLTIRGERRPPDAAGRTVLAERPQGRFERCVRLPVRVDPDRVEARYQDGVLVIEMQRPEDDLPRRIDIRTS